MNEHIPKTKVLFVITKSNWGGAQKYVYELATSLDHNLFEPVVALGGNGILASKLHESHIRVISLPSLERDINPLRDFASFRNLLRVMRDERPDAVHLNSSKIGGLGSFAARIAGIPHIIFTAHGWAFNEDRSIVSRLAIKLLYFITIALCDTTIAVSHAVAEKAPAWGMRNKIVVIHPPTHREDLANKKSAREHFVRAVPSLHGDNRLWVGIVAELHKNKGLSYAIEAMKEPSLQKNSLLLIVGAGQEEMALKNLVQASSLGGSVFFAGFDGDAPRLMTAFDIFLLPSTTEAFGYVLLEAGFAEVPVVASRVGGIPEIVDDNKTGLLIEPRKRVAIREAIQSLIDSPALRARLGSALHAKVTHEFSPEKIVSKTAKLYKSI